MRTVLRKSTSSLVENLNFEILKKQMRIPSLSLDLGERVNQLSHHNTSTMLKRSSCSPTSSGAIARRRVSVLRINFPQLSRSCPWARYPEETYRGRTSIR